MPFFAIIGTAAIAAFTFLGFQKDSHEVPDPPTPGGAPSWLIPVAVVGVGSLLLYKYGAKKLHV